MFSALQGGKSRQIVISDLLANMNLYFATKAEQHKINIQSKVYKKVQSAQVILGEYVQINSR